MDDIRLPLVRGRMDDISQEGEASSQPDSSVGDNLDSMSSQGARAIYEKEARIKIDFDRLDEEYREVCG